MIFYTTIQQSATLQVPVPVQCSDIYHHGWSSCRQIEAEETTTGRGRGQGLLAVLVGCFIKKSLQNKFDPNWSEEEKAAYYKRKERTTFKVG